MKAEPGRAVPPDSVRAVVEFDGPDDVLSNMLDEVGRDSWELILDEFNRAAEGMAKEYAALWKRTVTLRRHWGRVLKLMLDGVPHKKRGQFMERLEQEGRISQSTAYAWIKLYKDQNKPEVKAREAEAEKRGIEPPVNYLLGYAKAPWEVGAGQDDQGDEQGEPKPKDKGKPKPFPSPPSGITEESLTDEAWLMKANEAWDRMSPGRREQHLAHCLPDQRHAWAAGEDYRAELGARRGRLVLSGMHPWDGVTYDTAKSDTLDLTIRDDVGLVRDVVKAFDRQALESIAQAIKEEMAQREKA